MSVAATWTGAGDAGNWTWRVNWKKVGDRTNMNQQLTGAFYVGSGWVAGGCWDDDITSDLVGSFPKIPCSAPVRKW